MTGCLKRSKSDNTGLFQKVQKFLTLKCLKQLHKILNSLKNYIGCSAFFSRQLHRCHIYFLLIGIVILKELALRLKSYGNMESKKIVSELIQVIPSWHTRVDKNRM